MSAWGAFEPLPRRLGGTAKEGWAAAQHARACADLMAVSRVLPFAWVTFTATGSPAVPSVIAYNGMTGVGALYYPTVTRVTDSSFTVSWQPSQEDTYEIAEPLAIRQARASRQGTAAGYITCSWTIGESSVLVSLFDSTGTPAFSATSVTLRIT